jgi:biotin synthase
MMKIDTRLVRILERAQEGIAPNKEECVALLNYPETSLEASMLRACADATSRRRFGNEAIILGQIGIEISACPGRCKFCSFAAGYTHFEPSTMSLDEVLAAADQFTSSGDLYALFLMTMHTFAFDRLVNLVATLRMRLPAKQQIVVNIGDFDRAQAETLRQAGVNGAYHVCRLREGTDTSLDPEQRKQTIRVIREAGLDWYYCCEPVGPEHSAEELVDQMYLGIEYGCFQHAAMRRVYIPTSPLATYGQISELRLAQVTAVVALASLACPETRNIAVHEPNLIGLTSGANVIYAETGANPRDTEENTAGHRGRDIPACKAMLYEAGFEHLLVARAERRSLAGTFKE